QIPEEIGNLLGLELLSIIEIKGLTSQIPTSIFNISSLKTIVLSNTSLSGQIPSNIFNSTMVEVIALYGNKLE
ncbi:hypothetical protein Gotur_024303, partial [Gossypium turneri]